MCMDDSVSTVRKIKMLFIVKYDTQIITPLHFVEMVE